MSTADEIKKLNDLLRDRVITQEEFNSGLNHLGIFSLELSEENRILYAGTRAGGVYWINLDG